MTSKMDPQIHQKSIKLSEGLWGSALFGRTWASWINFCLSWSIFCRFWCLWGWFWSLLETFFNPLGLFFLKNQRNLLGRLRKSRKTLSNKKIARGLPISYPRFWKLKLDQSRQYGASTNLRAVRCQPNNQSSNRRINESTKSIEQIDNIFSARRNARSD